MDIAGDKECPGKRPLRSPKRIWEDNIKKNHRNVGCRVEQNEMKLCSLPCNTSAKRLGSDSEDFI